MSHITLIRHGQANSKATDEENYDRLSPLGHQQAAWLGEHLRDTRDFHPRIYCGTLRRHRETAEGLGFKEELHRDERLNELDYFQLAKLLEAQQGVPYPTEQHEFVGHLPAVFNAWQSDEILDPPETFAAFEGRISAALSEIADGDGPALVVTSGGVIASTMRRALGLDVTSMARLALATMNASIHRLFPVGGHMTPVLFNAVPHLDLPDRHHARTHV